MQRILQLLLAPGRCLSQTEIFHCSSQGGFRRQLSVSCSALNFCVCDSECCKGNAKSYFFPNPSMISDTRGLQRSARIAENIVGCSAGEQQLPEDIAKSGPGSEAADASAAV